MSAFCESYKDMTDINGRIHGGRETYYYTSYILAKTTLSKDHMIKYCIKGKCHFMLEAI